MFCDRGSMATADLLVLVLFALCTCQGVVGQDCSALASSGNCSFYLDCVEVQRLACGTTGFSLAYGETYCNRFETFRSNFNQAGELWVTAVQECLSSRLFSSSWYGNPTDCVELANLGLDLYPDCYLDSGLCQDILTNCTNLQALWSIFDFSDFTVKLARKLVFDAAGRCNDTTTTATTLRGLQCSNGDSNFEEFIETILSSLECGSNLVLDVIYVMDASGIVGADNFDIMRNFVADLTLNFNVGPTGTHVGVVRSSDTPTELTALGAMLDPVALDGFIRNIVFTGGSTRTDLAIDLARLGFQNSRQSEGVLLVMIVLTGGVSGIGPGPAAAAARAQGIQIISFGIGSGVNVTELNDIASGPEFVFLIDSFNQQAFDDVLQTLQLAVCFTPALAMVGSSINTTIQEGETRFLQLDFPTDGLTLAISVLQGRLSVFGSFSIQNPTLLSACEIQIINLTAGSNATGTACSQLFSNSVLAPESGGPSSPLLSVGIIGEENGTSFTLETSAGATNVTIGFTQEEYSVTENEGSVRVFVQRDDVMLDRDVSFTISTIMGPGEAVAGEDYEAVAPTEQTFDMSMGSGSVIGVDIIILDNSDLENRECFYVVISFSGSCFVDPPMARVCIDDDDSVVIEPEDPTYTIQEGSPVQYIDIPIVLRGMKEPGLECNVTVHTEDGSAIAGDDYFAIWINFTFSAANQSQNFTVHIIDDLTPEPDETFTVFVNSSADNCLVGTPATVTIIDDAPQIILHPVDLTDVPVGDTVLLTCVANRDLLPSISWSREGSILMNDSQQITIYEEEIEEEGSTLIQSILQICSIGPNNAGVYSCIAENDASNDTARFELTVAETPVQIVLQPVDPTDVPNGDTVLLTCVANGDLPLSISWSREGTVLMNDSQRITIYEEEIEEEGSTLIQSILQICSIGPNNAGVYSCIAENDASNDTARFELTVAETPVQIVLQPVDPTDVPNGDTVLLTCVANGDLPLSISWSREGTVLINDSQRITVFEEEIEKEGITFLQSILQVCSTGEDDVGAYSCIAENEAGNDTANFELSVASPEVTITIGFTQEEYPVTESEGTAHVFVERNDVVLDRDIPFTIFTIMDPGEAIAGEDYEAVAPTNLMFDMSLGSDQMIGVDITTLNDTVVENRECFYAVINSTDGSVIINPAMARVCIDDDDSVVIEPEDPTYTVPEGPPNQYIDISIVLRGMKEPGLECNVTVHTEDGSAIAGEDYFANLENITFSAANQSQIFQVHIIDDLTPEPDETFTVFVNSSDDNCLAGTPATVTIINDVESASASGSGSGLPMGERRCSNDITEDIRGSYEWQETIGGDMQQQICVFGGSGMAVRSCMVGGIWEDPDLSQCNTIFDVLENMTITGENVENVTQMTASAIEAANTEDQTTGNLDVVISIITGTTVLLTNGTAITEETTGNIVLIVDAVQGWSAAVIQQQSSIIVQTFENFTNALVEQEEFVNITVITQETVLQAQRVLTDELQVSGITLTVSSAVFNENPGERTAVNITRDDTVQELPLDQIISVVLPSSLFIQTDSNDNFTGVVFTLYETAILFPNPDNITVGTDVVGADIAGEDTLNLTEPLTILLRLNNASFENPRCASYDFNALGLDGAQSTNLLTFQLERNHIPTHRLTPVTYKGEGLGNWTTDGCITDRLTEEVVECECNHLTNFGVLVDIRDRLSDPPTLPPAAEAALSAISIIGSIFSLIGCTLVIITHLGFKKLRKHDISKFHAQLSIAIFGMMLVFVVGIEETQTAGGCVTISLLVQYFSMASVMWMAAEAWLMFQKLVIVFVQITTRYIITVSLICWLIPIPFVVVPVAVDHNFVISTNYCFISNIAVFFGAFFGPVIALMVFNTVIFVTVIAVLIKHSRKTRIKRKDGSKLKSTLRHLINILGIVSVFGLTWLFGAFTVTNKTRLSFLILFVLFSSFQGFFVFIFLCVINKNARETWILFLTRGRYREKTDSSKRLRDHSQKITPPKSSDQTSSTMLKNSSLRNFTLKASHLYDDYDMQEIEIEMYDTTEEEIYLNKGASD